MLAAYVPILVLFIIMAAVSLVIIVLSHILSPSKRDTKRVYEEPYECGLQTEGIEQGRYPVKFYLVAILFVLFDVEAVFIWPWAIAFRSFDSAGLSAFWYIEMIVFIAILLVGYFYLILKGALDWK